MDHLFDTEIFDEIKIMEYESKINVIDALIMESMKLQMIMNESESSSDFQIYQESFAKPDKNESTLTKVALAVPRFIYMLIKTIIDGFKKAFGKKESFETPKQVENLSEIIKNLTSNEDFMKMACGAVIGGFAAVKLFCKKKYTEVKTKIDNHREEKLRREDIKASSQKNFMRFRALAMDAIHEGAMFGLYVNDDNTIGIVMLTDIDKLRDEAVNDFLKSIASYVDEQCGKSNYYKSKSDFDKLLKDVMFDIQHNTRLYSYMIPDAVFPKDYTIKEYQTAFQKFTTVKYDKTIEKYMEQINASIVMAYQTFEKSVDKADAKEEKFSAEAQKKYCDDIDIIIGKRIEFMKEWIVELNDAINKAITEFNKLVTAKTPKLSPTVELSDYHKADWMKDKIAKDAKRQEEKEAEEKKKSEESKKDSDDKKEDKKETPEKEEKEPDKKDDKEKE